MSVCECSCWQSGICQWSAATLTVTGHLVEIACISSICQIWSKWPHQVENSQNDKFRVKSPEWHPEIIQVLFFCSDGCGIKNVSLNGFQWSIFGPEQSECNYLVSTVYFRLIVGAELQIHWLHSNTQSGLHLGHMHQHTHSYHNRKKKRDLRR